RFRDGGGLSLGLIALGGRFFRGCRFPLRLRWLSIRQLAGLTPLGVGCTIAGYFNNGRRLRLYVDLIFHGLDGVARCAQAGGFCRGKCVVAWYVPPWGIAPDLGGTELHMPDRMSIVPKTVTDSSGALNALYYPHIHFRSQRWLRTAL